MNQSADNADLIAADLLTMRMRKFNGAWYFVQVGLGAKVTRSI
jgi:hypothetical protein